MPRRREAVHPPTPLRKSHVAKVRGHQPGLRVLTLACTRSGTLRVRACPPLHPSDGAPSSRGPGVSRSWSLPPRSWPLPSPHPPGPCPAPPSSSFLLPPSPSLLWPQPREPRGRVSEKRFKRPLAASKVPAAEAPSGRTAAAGEEENAELRGPTDALTTSQLALPPRSPLRGSGEPGGGWRGGAWVPGAPFLWVST